MTRQTLQDDRYRTIGFIDTDSNGKKTLLNPRYQILGFYDPKQNVTQDARYRVIGHGDLLTTLLAR